MDCNTSHSEGAAGDDEMVPCSPLGGERGERKVAATLDTNIIAGVVNNSYILPPTPLDNDRFDYTFQRDISKEHLAALMGYAL